MPAKSKAQQKAAGAALSAKRGETPKAELKGASKIDGEIDDRGRARGARAQQAQGQARARLQVLTSILTGTPTTSCKGPHLDEEHYRNGATARRYRRHDATIIVLGKRDGHAEYAIMSFGGFLGMGERYLRCRGRA